MGADISRERFDPLRDYSCVLMQQGRVMLDADWNEMVSLTARRQRAAAADLGSRGPQDGIAGTAVVPRTTPDGFAISIAGGEMTIGRGRIYVDGILAENHGSGALEWDALLAESRGSAPTPYTEQPYLPQPPPLPTSGAHVVYVDVWEREVTALERPDLVEVAVGVDSTARTQVVWQVRVLPDDATGVDCSTRDEQVPGWPELVTPTAARLTTGTVPVDVEDDPCALPPSGGYRGLENQTYRVEVHDAGPPGTATFKWSRDNGSVAYPVEEVSATQLRPSSLGKDDVLRFRTGDWVEVLDDHRELAQLPGDIRKVEVHDDQGTMTLAAALSSDLVMTNEAARDRHLRVRRWDQHGVVRRVDGAVVVDLSTSADGVVPTQTDGVAIVLEHGLTVQLQASGGTFRQGDHWTFAARRSDTSVELLTDAPPRGTHHHYARLGVLTFPDTPADEGDCRVVWPPDCGGGECGDCSVCVTPESHASGELTIQDAVDQLRETGGTVCLSVGTYRLDAAVEIESTWVSVRGAGAQTVLTTNSGAFALRGTYRVTVENLMIISGGAAPAVTFSGTYYTELSRVTIRVFTEGDAALDTVPAVLMRSWNVFTRVEKCEIFAAIGLSSVSSEGDPLLTSGLDVVDCELSCWRAGIWFDAETVHYLTNSIRDNYVGDCPDGAIVALGSMDGGTGKLEVSRNLVHASGNGIVVGTSGITVFENEVVGIGTDTGGTGILVSLDSSLDIRGSVWVARNEVHNVRGSGIACQAPVNDLRIEDNRLERVGGDGIAMSQRASAVTARVVGNQLRDVVQQPMSGGDDVGIQVLQVGNATVSSNLVEGVAFDGGEKNDLAGIRLVAVDAAHVDDNTVVSVGSESDAQKFGIAVTGPFRRVHVRGNQAHHSRADVEGTAVPVWSGLFVGSLERDPGRDILTHGRMFTVEGRRTIAVGPGFARAAAAAAADSSEVVAVVENNTVTGSLSFPAAVISVPGDTVVSGNHCLLGSKFETPTLFVRARTATLQGNRARFGFPSIMFDVSVDAFAAVGNVTTRGITDFSGNPAPPPWDVLNPDGV